MIDKEFIYSRHWRFCFKVGCDKCEEEYNHAQFYYTHIAKKIPHAGIEPGFF